ncbi:MAG: dTDP-glucose 4,6-dehydratase [Campylobacterota bacterium]|nr:dTDP-glucose 4,6-dehydratase [Campylobacterota bacterium]
MFKNINKTILITGGAGFIGSNFIPYFLKKYPNYNIVNLDKLTYAGSLENLSELDDIVNNSKLANAVSQSEKFPRKFNTKNSTLQNDRYHFVKGDICNRDLVEFIFTEYDIKGVIHFAAESHVDNSIKNPGVFVQTNVNGTFTLIDVAYKYWMEKPFKYKEHFIGTDALASANGKTKVSLPRFHHISTDEVYGTLTDDPKDLFTELTPYAPNSPYSASKASSDMIVRAYNETYGMNTVITNCSNNYGPKQHDEKLIPTIVRKALAGESIPIYGDGKNIRDWLYVLDHCKGIDLVYHEGKTANTYNIGGRNERTNLQIVDKICEILDEKIPLTPKHKTLTTYKSLITFVEERAGHDRRYAIDASKLENELDWKADENFDSGIVKTVEWYLSKYLYKNKVI